ncbi:MAG TPA: amidase [Caldilineaceae bacterium]|nr:amidase [Caldilineaceae bacterium]
MSESQVFPGQLAPEQADSWPVTDAHIAAGGALIGLDFTEDERALMRKGVNEHLAAYGQIRGVPLPNQVMPAIRFDPRPPAPLPPSPRRPLTPSPAALPPLPDDLPANIEALAFAPVTLLAELIRTRRVTSLQLTEMYLDRLKRYGPTLECVVTLTEELARAQATRADAEIAAGRYRGPLHGIPWGAKDLLATRGYPTTWGAPPYKDQVIDQDATVVQRLEEAGAVLVAKLTLGALAWGDVWFGGKTRSPWNLEEGSSGSSAGSGAATAAGLVGFSIGTETFGSIVSPSNECGVTGLRPTFGRVSRHGAMALCWTLDKIGPMCRAVEDCALVFDAIYGPDGLDPTVVDMPFDYQPGVDLSKLRIGYLKADFEVERPTKALDDQSLRVLRALGADLIPIELPDYPTDALLFILWVEAAAAFDELTRSNRDDELALQIEMAWPNKMRVARLAPAVEYIQANRVRMLVMQAMAKLMDQVDLYVTPTFGRSLWLTNATGHPQVALPNGFRANGLPSTISLVGRLYDEGTLLAVAKALQDATDFHRQIPPRFAP